MADKYISVKAAIEAVCGGCNEDFENEPCEPTECSIRERLYAIPAADVVEVVRCGECANAAHSEAPALWCVGRGFPMQMVPLDGFCDKGRRACDGG